MKRCPKTGKQCLPSKALARKVHVTLGERADVNIFWCRHCRSYHLGHSNAPHRQQARLDQIFDQIRKHAMKGSEP
jgi:hypothetical protein